MPRTCTAFRCLSHPPARAPRRAPALPLLPALGCCHHMRPCFVLGSAPGFQLREILFEVVGWASGLSCRHGRSRPGFGRELVPSVVSLVTFRACTNTGVCTCWSSLRSCHRPAPARRGLCFGRGSRRARGAPERVIRAAPERHPTHSTSHSSHHQAAPSMFQRALGYCAGSVATVVLAQYSGCRCVAEVVLPQHNTFKFVLLQTNATHEYCTGTEILGSSPTDIVLYGYCMCSACALYCCRHCTTWQRLHQSCIGTVARAVHHWCSACVVSWYSHDVAVALCRLLLY